MGIKETLNPYCARFQVYRGISAEVETGEPLERMGISLNLMNMLLLMGLLECRAGEGCTTGPCNRLDNSSNGTFHLISNYTKQLFNDILCQASKDSEGKRFYNYNSFIAAASTFPGFGATGASDDARREVAAFFANVVSLVEGDQLNPSKPES
jgi:hypothetical protein